MPGEGDNLLAGEDASGVAVQRDPGVRKFTWEELSKLNQRHNAHVAVRGKVRATVAEPSQCYTYRTCILTRTAKVTKLKGDL